MEARQKRNIVFVGHAHSGKTSLTESLLYVGGAISRKGDVMQGNTVSDFHEDEIERKCSIDASYLKINYNAHQIQIIDTPGYADFIGETVCGLRAADAAVVVIDGVNGVEVGTEDAWQRAEELQMPRIVFINKTDKPEFKLEEIIASIQDQLSANAVVIDTVQETLIEKVAESDDKLLERYLEEGSLPPEEVAKALRSAIISAKIFPIFMGSALTDKGIKELLDAIITYMPSPLDRPEIRLRHLSTQETKTMAPSEDGAFTGFVFKSVFDPHIGQLSLVRVLSGTLNPNSDVFNINTSAKEHIGIINMLQGKEQISVPVATCGDIVAIPKLKNTHVGDLLSSQKGEYVLEPMVFPEPAISASIKPKTRADEEKISVSLEKLCEEDRTFRVNRDTETKELIISGVGDLHLKVVLERMKKRYHVEVDLGTPRVAYREAITKSARKRHKYKKQSGGRGQYGDVDLEVEPLPRDGEPFEFVNKIFGGAIPRNYIPSVEKGVRKAISEGVLTGSPIINIRVTVVDGSYHPVDSSDMAFQIAAAMALKEAVKAAHPVLLEPMMKVRVVVPDEYIGAISGDISSRRGRIMGTEAKGKNQIIEAMVPLAEMFKYATDLRSLTQGRGSYTMSFSHYEQCPSKVAEHVIEQRRREQQVAA